MARLLVLMGSGETTPTMVTPHQRILARLPDGPRLVLDTPYGFQENADELSAKTVEYFARNVGHDVEVASLRDASAAGSIARGIVEARVAEAAWVFAGPGSPSYLARQWLATSLPQVLRSRLTDPGRDSVTVLASAAACTVGRLAIPVYELYKVGQTPHWHPGLDLLRPLGLDAIVVPHYDNAEGGTHDTSCCYIGERRLRILEADLDPATWILGVDEHTAAILDLDAGAIRVEGRGRAVIRTRSDEHVIASGSVMGFDEVLAFVAAGAADTAVAAAPASATDEADPVTAGGSEPSASRLGAHFEAATAAGDLLAAAEVTAGLLEGLPAATRREAVRQVAVLARIAQAGLHEHRELVAPHVEVLLDLRQTARAERRFAEADAIRDALVSAGVEVRDGEDETRWDFTDPLDEVLGVENPTR